MANNYQDQLTYYKDGIKAFENVAYQNSIKYENNLIIQKNASKELFEPLLCEFPGKIINEVTISIFKRK